MVEGVIVRAYGGRYYVRSEGRTLECFLRGRLKKEEREVIVGDLVRLEEGSGDVWTIEEVLPRRNRLLRPQVANVDQVIIVFAVKEPDPHLDLLDRLLVLADTQRLRIALCFNKIDLATRYQVDKLARPYSEIGYTVLRTSAKTGKGIERLKRQLAGHISVFAGPSGVGKSALLNCIQPGFRLRTGDVSDKIGRGRHTTRASELLPLDTGGFVIDTPGFSRLDLDFISPEELQLFFPEIRARLGSCRFSSCLHYREPDCRIKEAVDSGEIRKSRYLHYLGFLQEIMEARWRRG